MSAFAVVTGLLKFFKFRDVTNLKNWPFSQLSPQTLSFIHWSKKSIYILILSTVILHQFELFAISVTLEKLVPTVFFSPIGCVAPTNTSLCILPSPSSKANQLYTGNSYNSLLPMSSITTYTGTLHTIISVLYIYMYTSEQIACAGLHALSRNHPAEEPLLL